MNTVCLDPVIVSDLLEVSNDDSFLKEVLTLYVEQAVDVIVALRASFSSGDTVAFKRAAHKLVGASLNIGATRVASVCRAVEHVPEITAAHLHTIEDEVAHLCSSLEIQDSPSASSRVN